MASKKRFRLGVAAAALMVPGAAWAECATTTAAGGTVTLNCDTTITVPAVNNSGNNPSTNRNRHIIPAPLNVNINSGATISGWGLYVLNGNDSVPTTVRPINVVNNGTVSHTASFDLSNETDGLHIITNAGSIRYSGNGSVTTNGVANASGDVLGPSTALFIYASGLENSVTFGSQAAPITGTFSGEAGIFMVAESSRVDAWFQGGSITATRRNNGIEAFNIIAADTINLSMAGGTVVNGGIFISQTAGPGHTAASTVTVTTDARVTNEAAEGVGLRVSSREAGADVTLTSGAAINVANIGVSLVPSIGAARLTTLAGTTINQTGTSGTVRSAVQFDPASIGFLTGSLVADLSGSITASGTGLQLLPANGNASVTIRSGGSVSGGAAGIAVTQAAGTTGLVTITNAGTLSGTNAVTATLPGTAFTLTNSGTLTGAVNVTGSAVAGSLFTNSGTWNTGGSNSTFAGSLTSSGTINANNGVAETLTVNGNLVLNAGSTLRLDIGAAQASTDRINVTGTATLAGSLAAFSIGSVFTPGTYTVLTANGGVTGTFASLLSNPDAPIRLTYDANNVFLQFDGGAQTTMTTSSRESVVFTAPGVTTNRIAAFSTQIIGRLLGGTPLYDQTFAAAFNSAEVQNGVTAARAAITTAGGPGVIIGEPVRIASTTTSTMVTGTSTYSLAGPAVSTFPSVITFGPATVQIGALSTCNVSSLPSSTRPTCTTGGIEYLAGADETNINTITDTVYTINEARTDTITETLHETYEISGQVAAVGSVHAEVQSGLFDLGARLLGRLNRVEAGMAGWADVYGFRVNQGGRRSALGLAGGVGIAVAPGLTLAFGIDRGRIDVDVASALESGRVELTEIGASLRYDTGPLSASLALVQGFGNASTRRAIFGSSTARYDVRVTGAALDLGFALNLGAWTLRPEAGIDWVRVSTSGFAETDTLGLVSGRNAARQVRATAGLSIGRDFGRVTLSARARYLAVLEGSERRVPVAFALAPARALTMTSPGEPDGALLGARIAVPLSKRASFSVSYDGRLGGGYTSHAGTASLRVAF